VRIGIEISGINSWRGPARSTFNLIKALSDIDGHNEYYLFSSMPILNIMPGDNFRMVYIPFKRLMPWTNVLLPFTLKKYRLDIFLFPYENYWVWKKVKTVIIVRQAQIYPWSRGIGERVISWLKQKRLKYVADKVVTVSHFNASQLELSFGIRQEDIAVIHNGVDPRFFQNGIEPESAYGEYILFVGGTDRRKNLDALLKAHSILVKGGNEINLVVVGGQHGVSPTILEKKQVVTGLGVEDRVFFHGIEASTDALACLYKGARVVVCPSYQETFGNVLLEAMACGVPLVVSNAPSIPEIAGDAAIYFDPYDVEEMAEKIGKVLKDDQLRNSLIARGKERVKRFSWENSARKLLNLIEDLGKKK
jgi:glycosyltransferase involved in cell wall biosynthesis